MLLQVILEGTQAWCSAHFGLRHRYPQGRGGHGASLQPGGAGERCVTLGLTTHAKNFKRNALVFKAVCVPGYIAYVLVCVCALNGAKGFVQGLLALLVILSVMNLIDRFWVDGYWVGHTNAWEIPGNRRPETLQYSQDKGKKVAVRHN